MFVPVLTHWLFLLLLLKLQFHFTTAKPDEKNIMVKEGKIMLAFIDIKSGNEDLQPIKKHTVQNLLTFQYVIERHGKFLADGDVGYVMYVTKDTSCVSDTMYMLVTYPGIVAFYGLRTSFSVLSLASLLSDLRIPTFVYGSSVLSDYILEAFQWKYVLPMTATATGQAEEVIPRLTIQTNANAVIVLADDTEYAQSQLPIILKSLNSHDISTLRHLDIPTNISSNPDFLSFIVQDLVEATSRNRTLTIIFLAHRIKVEEVIISITQRAEGLESYNIIALTSTQGCLTRLHPNWQGLGINVIRICQTYHSIKNLEQYFVDFQLWDEHGVAKNPIISGRLIENSQCIEGDNACFSNIVVTSSKQRPYSAYNHRIYIVLEAAISVLRAHQNDTRFLNDLTEHTTGKTDSFVPHNSDEFLAALKEESNKMDLGLHFNGSAGPFLNVDVSYNEDAVATWMENEDNDNIKDYLESRLSKFPKRMQCSEECQPGSYQHPLYSSENCWTCMVCGGNRVSTVTNAKVCTECPANRWTNVDRTNCSVVPTSLTLTGHPRGQMIMGVVVVCLVIILVTFGFYLYLWKNVVIVASGRDLAIFMFLGMICGLADAALIASRPGKEVCEGIAVFSHLFVVLILSPLFVRTLRILVIFKFAVTRKHLVKYVSKRNVYILMFLVSVPVMLSFVATSSIEKYGFTVKMVHYLHSEMVVNISCAPLDLTVVESLIGYVVILLVVSTIMGFNTRKLPENYKESMHILLCSLITLALVASCVPALLLLPGEQQVFALALIVCILSVTINVVIFVPKIYICLRYPEKIQLQRSQRSTVMKDCNSRHHSTSNRFSTGLDSSSGINT